MANNGYFACRLTGLAKEDKNSTQKEFSTPAGAKKLRLRGQPLHTNDDEHKSVPESESVAGSVNQESTGLPELQHEPDLTESTAVYDQIHALRIACHQLHVRSKNTTFRFFSSIYMYD